MSSTAKAIGAPFHVLPQVDSTNNYAMALARAGMAQHGTAVFSHLQTGGKGQRGRQWFSEGGQNIILSVVLEPRGFRPDQQFLLSRAIAVAVYRFFNKYAGGEVCIKWPNDLYWRDRKAGGILIENILQQGEWKFAIAGIGININQTRFDEVERKVVSLRQITGRTFGPAALAGELCTFLEGTYRQLQEDGEALAEAYRSILYRRGEKVRLRRNNKVFEATINGVSSDGRLMVTHAVDESFAVGEVEWVEK